MNAFKGNGEMMVKIRYFDTKDEHNTWWPLLDKNAKLISSDQLTNMFLKASDTGFTNRLKQGDKYFFIIHTGEAFFNDDVRANNLVAWKATWETHYKQYSERICIMFVSGGDLRITKADLPQQGHFYFWPTIDKKTIIAKFKDIIENWEKTETLKTGKEAPESHSLRSQILTPFVALHLALQDSFDEKGKPKDNPLIFGEECKNCCADINGLDKTLDEFLKNVKNATDEQKNEIKKKCGELKGRIVDLCKVNKTDELATFKDLYEGGSGNGLIGDFAKLLEEAVNETTKMQPQSTKFRAKTLRR